MKPIPSHIPKRCYPAVMALRGDYGYRAQVAKRGGWWHHDDVTAVTGHADSACKLRLAYAEDQRNVNERGAAPLIERRDWPREDGRKPDLAVFRLSRGAVQGTLFYMEAVRP